MFVKPAPGRLVRDPVSKQPLPESGRDVQETTYWVRRVACGDAILVDPPPLDSPAEPVLQAEQIPDSSGEEKP